MTVGVVQKEIHKGMTKDQVAQALGSPNIVSSDKLGLESWIYDKIATEVSYKGSSSDSGFGIIIAGIWNSSYSEAAAQTQRTLTVIIKFKENQVHDFSYHTTRF